MGTYSKLRKYSSNIHVYEFNPAVERFDTSIGTRWRLEKLSKMKGEPREDEEVVAKINGAFFAMDGSTEYIGSYVDEGLYYQGSSYYYPTLIYWKSNNRLTIENRPNQDRHSYYQDHAWWAVGVPWTLILDNKKDFQYDKETLIREFGHPYTRAPRTLLGQKKDGTIVWVVVDGRKLTTLGVNIEQSASIMADLGCTIAVNLDGGGSSEMIVNDQIKNQVSDGSERSIGTAFMAYAKKPTILMEQAITKTVKPYALTVRSGPGIQHKAISYLSRGSEVKVITTVNGWSKIRYNGNSLGYVSDKYLV